MLKPKTLFDKIWEDHIVHTSNDGTSTIYIDRHLVHEVTSQFEGLRNANRKVCCPKNTVVADRNVPTTVDVGIEDEESHTIRHHKNAMDFGIPYFDMNDIDKELFM